MSAQKDTVISNYIESRLTKLETTQENIAQTLVRMESKIDAMESKFEARFNSLESKFDTKFISLERSINNRIWTNFYWTLAAFAANYVMLAKILHWIP